MTKLFVKLFTAVAFAFTTYILYFIVSLFSVMVPAPVVFIGVVTLLVLACMFMFKKPDWEKDFYKSWF